jgi:DtxR family Mn-dependent transcriptional regulator
VVGVSQDNPSFLQYLDSLGIKLGTSISVVQKIVFDGSLEITINNKSAHISKDVAKNLLIKQK